MQSHFYWPYWRPDSSYHNEPALGGYTLLLKFTWSYLQSPCSLLHNDPTLGGYTGWSFMSIRQLQVPGFCKHDNPVLGGYICGIFSLWLMIEMNNPVFFKVATLILKQVLSYHYVLLLRLGCYRWYAYKGEKIFKFSVWSRPDWPGVCNNHDPVSPIIMTRRRLQLWPGAINIYEPAILNMINRQILPLQAGWKSDEYLKTKIN